MCQSQHNDWTLKKYTPEDICKCILNSNILTEYENRYTPLEGKGQNSICKIHVASLLDQVQNKTKVWKTGTFDTNSKEIRQ